MGDTMTMGSGEMPEVVKTLTGVLPVYTAGPDLKSALQTFDSFLDMGCDRTQIADLIAEAAKRTPDAQARARIEWAVQSIRRFGRAAAPYDHAEAMAEYVKNFKASYAKPAAPVAPPAPVDANAEVFSAPKKREHPLILNKLDKIEAEMKRIGYWANELPVEFDAQIARGEIHSFLDAPTFPLWLQRIFIPHARTAATNDTLPKNSEVGVMAVRQWDYMACVPEAHPLMGMLSEFDELVLLAVVGGA